MEIKSIHSYQIFEICDRFALLRKLLVGARLEREQLRLRRAVNDVEKEQSSSVEATCVFLLSRLVSSMLAAERSAKLSIASVTSVAVCFRAIESLTADTQT